jgi:hypothetical protein
MAADPNMKDPAAVLAFMKSAPLEERLRIGAAIVKANLRGMFKYTNSFYYDREALTCLHVNRCAAFFASVPEDWFSIPHAHVSHCIVQPVEDFSVTRADPRCPECQHHATVLLIRLKEEEEEIERLNNRDDAFDFLWADGWKRKKLSDLGFCF